MVIVVLAAVFVASRIQLNEYVLTPGQAQAVGPLVSVPTDRSHRIDGPILLTDVYLTRVSLLSYLPDRLNGDAQMVTGKALLGPATPPAQLTAQGYLEMAQAQSAAKAAALARLGYAVPEHNAGTLVFAVSPGSPASPLLSVGQIVTAVDGTPTPDACSFIAALHALGPGDTVALSVEQATVTPDAVQRPGPTKVVKVRLARRPSSAGSSTSDGCPGGKPSAGYLGVVVETQQDYTDPVPVSVRTQTIGGPSAGLAMTLAIIDKLYGGHLTGGHTVAATGTISPTGQVGDVGGVREKTVAVENAGATVFLVPPDEYPTAKAKDIPSLHIYKVSSLDDALSVLRRLGGHVPPVPDGDPRAVGLRAPIAHAHEVGWS
ncbi:MAG: S16 family serine protease [Acidimicrobiales bacterium]